MMVQKPELRPIAYPLTPFAVDAEEALLGCLLLRGDELLSKVASILKAGDFYRSKNAEVYQAMLDLSRQGVGIDQVTVAYRLRETGLLDETYKVPGAITPAFLLHLLALVDSPHHAEFYAKIVADYAQRRRKLVEAGRLAKEAYEGKEITKPTSGGPINEVPDAHTW